MLSKLLSESIHCFIKNFGFLSPTGAETRMKKMVLGPTGFLN